MIIISDTSPISNLIQIKQLSLLELLFDEVFVPPIVHEEIMKLVEFDIDLSSYTQAKWIKVKVPQDLHFIQTLEGTLDKGESEAIALALETNATLLLIDERLGTQRARDFGLNTTGLIGCLVEAKQKGFLKEIKPIILALEDIAQELVDLGVPKTDIVIGFQKPELRALSGYAQS